MIAFPTSTLLPRYNIPMKLSDLLDTRVILVNLRARDMRTALEEMTGGLRMRVPVFLCVSARSTELAAHRVDTEGHKRRYMVREP